MKKPNFRPQISKTADKKSANNEGRLYLQTRSWLNVLFVRNLKIKSHSVNYRKYSLKQGPFIIRGRKSAREKSCLLNFGTLFWRVAGNLEYGDLENGDLDTNLISKNEVIFISTKNNGNLEFNLE